MKAGGDQSKIPSIGGPASADSGSTDLLREEYKIIHTKIEKLGEDMFKVRSWCITLFTGVIAGAKLIGEFSPWVLILLFPVVFAFQLVEYRQRQISRRSSRRAYDIEILLRQHLRKAGKNQSLAPRIATELFRAGHKDKELHTLRNWFADSSSRDDAKALVPPNQLSSQEPDGPKRKTSRLLAFWRCLVTQADFFFYFAQYFIVGVMLICFIGASLLGRSQHDKSPKLTIQLGTNAFSIGQSDTNLIITNSQSSHKRENRVNFPCLPKECGTGFPNVI
ncbi:MAG TPA: hypothetical protein VKY92_21815 [Verrucomicrobiae bacterium]|nr:hypothetical protein [Verrucomicrobiae bacterium]